MTTDAPSAAAAAAAVPVVPTPAPGADPPAAATPTAVGAKPTVPYAGPGTPAAPAKAPLFSAAAWAPLRVELFRSLWVATSVAQIGTWVREAAGPTLMESLTRGWGPVQAEMVARVLVFSNLPIMLLSVFAGALADVLDRRRLLIVTQVWMIVVSAALGLMTLFGVVTPGLLLGMTFLLGVGTAAFGPALQAVLPELVPRPQFALAINLNSIALNVARAVGPALFIVVVSVVPGDRGAGVSFLLTAASFVAAVWVLLRWKRPPQRAAIAGERVWGGIRAGFAYTVHSRANRAILLRVFTFIVPAVVIWSQVPLIATGQLGIGQEPAGQVGTGQVAAAAPPAGRRAPGAAPAAEADVAARAASAEGRARHVQQASAMLFAFVGLGAILGVLLMPGLHERYSIDPVVNACTLLFAGGLLALSMVHQLWLAAPILVFMGINWVIIPTNFNTATQKSVPMWVKGRAISFYLTVLFGSFAVGGAIWGRVTAHAGIQVSLLAGGLSMAALVLLLARWFPLTLNEGLDLAPAYPPGGTAAPPPVPGADALAAAGRVELTAKYSVGPTDERAFRRAMRDLGAQRRRNGAAGWRLARARGAGQWVETAVYRTADEYRRQFNRLTKADLKLQERAAAYLAVSEPNPVRVAGENLWV